MPVWRRVEERPLAGVIVELGGAVRGGGGWEADRALLQLKCLQPFLRVWQGLHTYISWDGLAGDPERHAC